jgi:hypothetical protein
VQRAVFANEGSKSGLVKNLLTRSVSKDATVAVSLSIHMRGEPIVEASSKRKKTIFLNLIELLHTCRSTPNLVYAPGDRIAMLRGGSTSGEVDARSGLRSENTRASK